MVLLEFSFEAFDVHLQENEDAVLIEKASRVSSK